MTVHDEEFAGGFLGRILDGEAPAQSFADAAIRDGARLRRRRRTGLLGAGAAALVAVVAVGAVYAPTWGSAPARPGSAPAVVATAAPTPTPTVVVATNENITALLLALLPGSTAAGVGDRLQATGKVTFDGPGGQVEVTAVVTAKRKPGFNLDEYCPSCAKLDLGGGRWLVSGSHTDKLSNRPMYSTELVGPDGNGAALLAAYTQLAQGVPLAPEEARRILTDPRWAGLLGRD